MTPEEIDRIWGAIRERHATAGGPGIKTREQGAATSVLVATSPLLDGIGGRYFEDCNEARRLPPEFSPRLRCPASPGTRWTREMPRACGTSPNP